MLVVVVLDFYLDVDEYDGDNNDAFHDDDVYVYDFVLVLILYLQLLMYLLMIYVSAVLYFARLLMEVGYQLKPKTELLINDFLL